MEITLKVALDEASLGALNDLTTAIAGFGSGSANVAAAPATADTGKTDAPAETGPIFWADSKDGQFGKVNKQADFDKLKKKSDTVYKIPESKFKELQEALKEKNEAARKAAEAAKNKADDEGGASDTVPSIEDIVAVFSKYLPKDLDADERKARAAFVKPMLERFGAAKASEIPEEHRALAINLVERKMAGEDVDPKTAKLGEVKASGGEESDDLV